MHQGMDKEVTVKLPPVGAIVKAARGFYTLRSRRNTPMECIERYHAKGGSAVTKHINYEDDIFALTLMVRNLLDIVKLDADPAFFRDKLASDLFAIDAIMTRLSEALAECGTFVKRTEHIRELAKLKKMYTELLDETLLGQAPLSQALVDYADKLRRIRDFHGRDAVLIRESLARSAVAPQETELMVSEEEFKSLLDSENRI